MIPSETGKSVQICSPLFRLFSIVSEITFSIHSSPLFSASRPVSTIAIFAAATADSRPRRGYERMQKWMIDILCCWNIRFFLPRVGAQIQTVLLLTLNRNGTKTCKKYIRNNLFCRWAAAPVLNECCVVLCFPLPFNDFCYCNDTFSNGNNDNNWRKIHSGIESERCAQQWRAQCRNNWII